LILKQIVGVQKILEEKMVNMNWLSWLFVSDAEIRATLNSYQYLKRLITEKLYIQNRLEQTIFVCDFYCKLYLENQIFFV